MRFKYGLGLLLYTHSQTYADLRACYAGCLSSKYVNLLTSWLSSNSNVILQIYFISILIQIMNKCN